MAKGDWNDYTGNAYKEIDNGRHFAPREIAKLCYEEGWTDADKLLTSISVCIAESNGYEKRKHVNPDGSIDRGIWMINDRAHPDVTDTVAYNAKSATKVARRIYVDRGNTFNAWAAFTNGSYKDSHSMGYAFDGVANFLREKHGYPVPAL